MPPKYHIQVENSAPSQGKPAKSVYWAISILSAEKVKSVVDLGCGRLRNLIPFQENYEQVTLVDTKFQCDRIAKNVPEISSLRLLKIEDFINDSATYDAIFLISVLHVLDKLQDRKELISLSQRKLRNRGFLIIDVPSGIHYYRIHCTPENKYKDGWVMGNKSMKTFYRSYYASELDNLVTSCSSLKFYKKVWFDKHLVRIWQK